MMRKRKKQRKWPSYAYPFPISDLIIIISNATMWKWNCLSGTFISLFNYYYCWIEWSNCWQNQFYKKIIQLIFHWMPILVFVAKSSSTTLFVFILSFSGKVKLPSIGHFWSWIFNSNLILWICPSLKVRWEFHYRGE